MTEFILFTFKVVFSIMCSILVFDLICMLIGFISDIYFRFKTWFNERFYSWKMGRGFWRNK